ncbi:hypothetical protein D1AOALGA4SA_12198 [Olavius algarvensis Delta 1 endosymbiont]|nr:hypothetical protein D1AOALGA4SA_12198 [Olavius algarvensis Delta 1 endosymbiont]
MDNSVEVYRQLEKEFQNTDLHRPMRIERYESGTELEYTMTSVETAAQAGVRLVVEKFIGGGFAGQVYRVRVLDIDSIDGFDAAIQVGGVYAVKILIPPSGFSRLFRNALYWLGFQGPFQLQVNPAAARAGALWQKFIRRGSRLVFGDEQAVVDIYATFVDQDIGSCGELSEWVEGRTWRLEVDDQLGSLKRWIKGKAVDPAKLGSPEYRAKYAFMQKFVALLHDMGAPEFARQYEWSTWKSQPNCLKRSDTEDTPDKGLTAVDFRAGLALLPFLPMSPGDFKLIFTGLQRASLVQFDRGDLDKLKQYVDTHQKEFAGTEDMLAELHDAEAVYRNSVPDITHNHLRLLYSARLWGTIFKSAVDGWKIRNLVNDRCRQNLQNNRPATLLFALLGLIPLIGRFFRRIWGQTFWRRHYLNMLTSWDYLKKSFRAKFIEKIIGWHRDDRVSDENAIKLSRQSWRCTYHLPLSLLPAGLHRILTDWQHAKERLDYYLRRPVRLYFNNELREQWLRDMVSEGQEKHLLDDDDAAVILSQIKEPYIQKYLKSLAVHVCTLPVTQVVSLMVAVYFVVQNPQLSWQEALGLAGFILVAFQLTPISPGSLVRGFYVLYLVIREKNFKDYNIAVFLGFFKYIGYLAFPIQMTYRYPALARFMAGHWATEAVHVVPVFGERGALLEHKIFNLFYNWPLTIRHRMHQRRRLRSAMPPRYWHVALCAICAMAVFVVIDLIYLNQSAGLPGLKQIWGVALALPLICGAAVTLGAGGAAIKQRIIGAVLCGVTVGISSIVISLALAGATEVGFSQMAVNSVWRVFVFTIFSVVGVLVTEINLPEPADRGQRTDDR